MNKSESAKEHMKSGETESAGIEDAIDIQDEMKKVDVQSSSPGTLLAKNTVLLPTGVVRVKQFQEANAITEAGTSSSGSATVFVSAMQSKAKGRSYIWQYFNWLPDKNESECKIADCQRRIKGNHCGNLLRHIVRNHPHEACMARLMKRKQQTEQFSTAGSSTKKKKIGMIAIDLDQETLKNACCDLLAVDARPFSVLEDSGFRKIIDPIIRGLNEKSPDATITIDRQSMKHEIRKKAASLRRIIANEVRGQLVSLKIDSATRLGRQLMSINVQYITAGEIVIRNLCVKEIFKTHTAENLKDQIIHVLQQYEIKLEMIYSCITDNAANLVKAVKHLNEEYTVFQEVSASKTECASTLSGKSASLLEEQDVTDLESGSSSSAEEDKSVSFEVGGGEMGTEGSQCSMEEFCHCNVDDVLQELGIRGVRCAAYTLHHAIGDSLKQHGDMHAAINHARKVCKMLRPPTLTKRFKRIRSNNGMLDVAARWYSLYDTLASLFPRKDASSQISGSQEGNWLGESKCEPGQTREDISNITDSQWVLIEEFCTSLKPAKMAINILQNSQLTVGDFYLTWLRCKVGTMKVMTILARHIVEAMNRREELFMSTPIFSAAMYMDPRFRLMLTTENQQRAERHLRMLWVRLHGEAPNAKGNPRNKTALAPGHSLMDWIRLGNSGVDLTGVGGTPRVVTMPELASHNKQNDAWIAIRGIVFNVTRYMDFHPGGHTELMRGVGKDATKLFENVHAWVNYQSILQKCVVGRLSRTATPSSTSPPVPEIPIPNKISCSTTTLGLKESCTIRGAHQENLSSSPNLFNLNMDWKQTTNSITLFYQTVRDYPGIYYQLERISDTKIIIKLSFEKDIIKHELELAADVEWPPTWKRNFDTMEVDFIFTKKVKEVWKCQGSHTISREPNTNTRSYKEYEVLANIPLSTIIHLLIVRAKNYLEVIPVGKHVEAKMNVLGTEVSRSYTPVPPCLHPDDMVPNYKSDCICLMIKRYPGGALSPSITSLETGQTLMLSNALGAFVVESFDRYSVIHMLAGGTGLTVMLPIIKRSLARRSVRTINLLNFNKDENNMFYVAQLDKAAADKKLKVTHILSQAGSTWTGHRGTISDDLLKELIAETSPEGCVFTCGPRGFIQSAKKSLQKLGWKPYQMFDFDD